MLIQKSNKATHQHFPWTAVSFPDFAQTNNRNECKTLVCNPRANRSIRTYASPTPCYKVKCCSTESKMRKLCITRGLILRVKGLKQSIKSWSRYYPGSLKKKRHVCCKSNFIRSAMSKYATLYYDHIYEPIITERNHKLQRTKCELSNYRIFVD